MKEYLSIINHPNITSNKICTHLHQQKKNINNHFQSQIKQQINISSNPTKSLFTFINKNKSDIKKVPYQFGIKCSRELGKECSNNNNYNTKKNFNHFNLPQIHNTPLKVYQSHSKSPFRKRDFTAIKEKVKQTQLRLIDNNNTNKSNNINTNNININMTNETSGTTSAEEFNNKLTKISILYEVEKATSMIQKNWKGWMVRKTVSLIKESEVNGNQTNTNTNTNDNNNNDNIDNVYTNNKRESQPRLKLLDIIEDNDASLLHSLSNVSRLSIKTQDLNYDSGDNDDLVDFEEDF